MQRLDGTVAIKPKSAGPPVKAFPATVVMQRPHGAVDLSAGPPAKARQLPDKIPEGRGGGSSSETPGGGCDPPVGCHNGRDSEQDAGRGKIIWQSRFWQSVNSKDKWGTCTWQDFGEEWSDNIEEVYKDFLEAEALPGGCEANLIEKNVVVPDYWWPGSSTTLYRYDFVKMRQINEKTGMVRDIRRIAVLRSADSRIQKKGFGGFDPDNQEFTHVSPAAGASSE